ncbi:MAG: tRNA (adenosine(37)-N6)-threonylcarbamoyltransferase complex transferase subunit TsaD [Paracoccaceae bacterium]|nr:tRNA (adenosine(37)-N6)-threonylcarbamoyltransferase complex transferase subunit TsaD [Paracoccaceae bacterium]
MAHSFTVLGLESSCDDTAAALLRCDAKGKATILSSIVHGQSSLHARFGGVVPEIAARAHAEMLDFCVEEALSEANVSLNDINAIAVTAGPGLIGGVVSGVMCAKGLSMATGAPLYGINHLAGHALTPRMTDDVAYPYLMLLVSGGHCQFLIVHGPHHFERLGGTIDDAPGEAFDKVARLVGLPQPGGPSVEQESLQGDATIYSLPRPLLDRPGCDLSFSGLKTAVLRTRNKIMEEHGGLPRQARSDLCAGFQAAVVDVLAEKTERALELYLQSKPTRPALCVAGGVAANSAIRSRLEIVSQQLGSEFIAPPLVLCTDNAAMIAFAALEQMGSREADDLTLSARPRWPLDEKSPAMLGSGKKGAKA